MFSLPCSVSCMWSLLLWVTVTAGLVASSAASSVQDVPGTDCSSSKAANFNFFPQNTKNMPEGWTRANQRRAGNLCDGQLLPVALFGAPKPMLHFLPQHELLKLGAVVKVLQWEPAGDNSAAVHAQQLDAKQSKQNRSLLALAQTADASSLQESTVGAEDGGLQLGVSATDDAGADKLQHGASSPDRANMTADDSSGSSSLIPTAAFLDASSTATTNDQHTREADSASITNGPRNGWMGMLHLNSLSRLPWANRHNGMRISKATNSSGDSQQGNSTAGNATTMSELNSTSAQKPPSIWTVAQPAGFTYSAHVNGRLWFTSPVHYPGSGVPTINFNGNATAGRRDLFDPTIFKEGINTLVISVTILEDTAILGDGRISRKAPPTNETFSSAEIDFYFFMWGNASHDSRPSALVDFESCRPEAAIRFTKAYPTPVLIDGFRLTYTPVALQTSAFFLPVYYVYGSFKQGLDGSTDMHTDNSEGNVKNFGLYLTRLPGSPDNFKFAGPQLDGLKEGWWQFTVEGSLWVPLPHLAPLLSLSGMDRFGNRDVLYREVQPNGAISDGMSLLGSAKGAGWVLPKYGSMRVAMQKAVTTLDFLEGPSAPLVLGDKATFSWQFTGLDSGHTTCRIDGAQTVSFAGPCSSPLTYTIRTTLNQTLTVAHKDVCGVYHNASLTFGPGFGWKLDAGSRESGSLTLNGSSPSLALQRNSSMGRSMCTAAYWWLKFAVAAAAVMLLQGGLL